jgi:HSP20 family protein
MSQIHWQPPLALHQQIDREREQAMPAEKWRGLFSHIRQTPWVPAIELQETTHTLILKAQVPGLEAPEQLDIQLSENTVFITGEYPVAPDDHYQEILRSEFHYGEFRRVIPLPSPIQWQDVTAIIADGLLTLIMFKAITHE